MNKSNLHEIIDRYEANYERLNEHPEPYEKFKWQAMKSFRDIWLDEKNKNLSFSEMFHEAIKNTSIMINGQMTSPATGIVKMAEVEPEEVKRLFYEVLLSPYETIDELQNNMDSFIDGIEEIRKKHFPKFYRYKQERHAVSCYLSFIEPDKHYVYRYSEAEEFAKYIEFGKDIGSGQNFKLRYYYELADIIVEALRQHQGLIDKYQKMLDSDDSMYRDDSLHLMAFDLIYCSRVHNLCYELEHKSKAESIKEHKEQEKKEAEALFRQEQISQISRRIHEIDVEAEQYNEISLVGVEVTQKLNGTGVVIEQEGCKIVVSFGNKQCSYIIDRKYSMRPVFEDDEETVDAFTKLNALIEEKKKLAADLKRLMPKT